MWNLVLLVLAFAATLHGGLCVGEIFNPANNSIITEHIGTVNVSFECVLSVDGVQAVTQWNIVDFDGRAGLQSILNVLPDTILEGNASGRLLFTTFRSRLIFPEFIEVLDRTTLLCGLPGIFNAGEFYLFVYREPLLLNMTNPVRYVEGDDVMVSVEGGRTAHPFPTTYEWTMEGAPLINDSRMAFGYPYLSISGVQRGDSGTYSLTATNHLLDDPAEELGTGTGSFTLDVIYGPEIEPGPGMRAVRFGEPLSLLCGTNLVSNPPATITWTDPTGNEIMDNAQYDLINDNSGVWLNFTNTISTDTGIWNCSVRREAADVSEPGNPSTITSTRETVIAVDLIVVVAPGQPLNLTVDDTGATWANLCWQIPTVVGEPGITRYTVIATITAGSSSAVTASTADNSTATYLNVTGLLPKTRYSFRVQAVAASLGVDNPSGFSQLVTASTEVTVPAPICSSAVPDNGNIVINWRFDHTGGQPLTSVSVSYVQGTGSPQSGPDVAVTDTSAAISSLVAGFSYTATVTAASQEGSAQSECPVVLLEMGIPQNPDTPVVEDLGGGSVRLTLRTPASGVGTGGEFHFLVIQNQIDMEVLTSKELRRNVENYRSGESFSFDIEDLVVGDQYTFGVKAVNGFGSSAIVTSQSLLLTSATVEPLPSGSNAGAIAGGIIGALLGVILIAGIVILLVFIYFRFFKSSHSYKPASTELKGEPPSSIKVEMLAEGSPDIGEDLASPKEIHYADLESFRPPNSAEIVTAEVPLPIPEQERPVEYAVIDSFKKAPPPTDASKNDKAGTSATEV